MFLELNGIRIELVFPADIARFKGFGYKEVVEEKEVVKEPKLSKTEKVAKSAAKEGE
jgi:hypothetical protein